MRAFDLSPLYRSTVGFDHFANLFDNVLNDPAQPGYPPYNIERTDENAYRISMAVAGFSEEDLSIETRQNQLTISGSKSQTEEKDDANYLHRGIATRNFQRRFQLADHVEVRNAALENGLLHIDLVREIPEVLKPRQIAITRGQSPASRTLNAEAETVSV